MINHEQLANPMAKANANPNCSDLRQLRLIKTSASYLPPLRYVSRTNLPQVKLAIIDIVSEERLLPDYMS